MTDKLIEIVQYSDMLITIFLQIPTIPNPVGVVRVSEFRNWYRKVKGDNVASAYVLHPLWTSFISIYEGSSRIDFNTGERSLASRKSKLIFKLAKGHRVLQFIY